MKRLRNRLSVGHECLLEATGRHIRSKKLDISQTAIIEVVESYLEVVFSALASNGSVTLGRLGSISAGLVEQEHFFKRGMGVKRLEYLPEFRITDKGCILIEDNLDKFFYQDEKKENVVMPRFDIDKVLSGKI